MNLFRMIPGVDQVMENEEIKKLFELHDAKLINDTIRTILDEMRDEIKKGLDEDALRERLNNIDKAVAQRLADELNYSLRPVINATGVIIHTNLGRSKLPKSAQENIMRLLSSYSNLEYDLDRGERGLRYTHIEEKLKKITGAEAALVVNNNAAAVMLVLDTLSKNKEVITSRGELIEIGGSFRIPDVCERSLATLREVGTTNKTHLRDYENAINEETGAILKVHTSNYKILGFTESVSASEIATIKGDLPLIEDLGSGVLINLEDYGLEHEPTVMESVASGVDVVTFSGDKLLGGPQAGIIVGKEKYISQIKKNQLLRALRVDKMTIAALETILNYYIDKNKTFEIPTIKMITESYESIEKRAEKLFSMLEGMAGVELNIAQTASEVGGGSLPNQFIKSKAIEIDPKNISAAKLEEGLRKLEVPIITRIYKDKILLDLRTIDEEEYEIIANELKGILGER